MPHGAAAKCQALGKDSCLLEVFCIAPFLRFPDSENRQPPAKFGAQERAANKTVRPYFGCGKPPLGRWRDETLLDEKSFPNWAPNMCLQPTEAQWQQSPPPNPMFMGRCHCPGPPTPQGKSSAYRCSWSSSPTHYRPTKRGTPSPPRMLPSSGPFSFGESHPRKSVFIDVHDPTLVSVCLWTLSFTVPGWPKKQLNCLFKKCFGWFFMSWSNDSSWFRS